MTVKELWDCTELIYEAGHNRESTVTAWHDGEMLDVVELEEK